jgi:ATP-dependent exoDNAse (exonuclease V) alpha subunit
MDHILSVLAEWSGCHDVQVLGVTKRGASGVRNINASLHAMASATKPSLEGWGFAEGDPIIHLANDYQKELWNGSLGRIESVLSLNLETAVDEPADKSTPLAPSCCAERQFSPNG